jgi:hypothetical protein
MATLPVYSDTTPPQLPGNIGTESDISAARRVGPLLREGGDAIAGALGMAGRQVDEYLKKREDDQTAKEIGQGHLLIAQIQTSHVDQLHQATAKADPNDVAAIGQQFVTDALEPDRETFLSKFTTPASRKWAEEAYGQYEGRAIERIASDGTIAAGAAAIINADKTLNLLSNNAVKEPGTIQQGIDTWLSGIEGLKQNPRLDAEQRAKLDEFGQKGTQSIVFAGIKSAIEREPTSGIARLNDVLAKHPDWLTGAQTVELQKSAEVQTKMTIAQQRADRAENDRINRQNFDAAASDWISKTTDAQGHPTIGPEAYQRFGQIAHMPGAEPGMLNTMLGLANRTQLQLDGGSPTLTNPTVREDFRQRMFLGPDDPKQLTVPQIVQAQIDGQLSDKDAQMFRTGVDELAKNPQRADEMKQLDEFLKSGSTPGVTNPQNYYEFKQQKTQQFLTGLRSGIPAKELLDPESKDFIGFATQEQLSANAIHPAQEAAPLTAIRAQLSSAVDRAVQITTMKQRGDDDDAINDILRKNGVTGVDVKDTAWCAALVNATLKEVGITGTGDQRAESFKTWGFPISASNVQKGDVFYTPAAGYTGHVGFVTGAAPRMNNGVLQVQVVSSHLKGDPANPGGVEWRNAAGMIFRRAQPPLDQIKPGMLSRVWSSMTGYGPDQTTPPTGDE